MTALGARTGLGVRLDVDLFPGRAVTALAIEMVWRAALVVVVLVAAMSALVAATYRTIGDGADGLSRSTLAALAGNPAIRTLFGEPIALETSGGFTVWRTGTFVAVVVAVWGLLSMTRVTRAEEDAGRWDLLLAGRVPITAVMGRHLFVVIAALVFAGLATAVALVAAGTTMAGALLHGAGVGLIGAFFAAAGALAGQVLPSRGTANGVGAAVIGGALLARMVGDGVDALAWLRWLSPFGLIALVRPFESNHVLPLLVLTGAAAALVVLALAAASRRDLHVGWLPLRAARQSRLALLSSISAFALRRLLRPLAGWAVGVGVYYLLIGLLAGSLTRFLADNARFAALAEAAGFAGLDSVQGYAAALFSLLAVPVGIFAAIRVAALSADETDRRLTLVLSGQVSRLRLLSSESTAAALGAVVLVAVAGIATWAGATAAGGGLSLGLALAGAVNVLPIVALCLGAAVFALGWAPRWTALIGVLPGAGGFLWRALADSAGSPAWVVNVSPFAHLAGVPLATPNWSGMVTMTAVAALALVVGAVGYRRRDLRG